MCCKTHITHTSQGILKDLRRWRKAWKIGYRHGAKNVIKYNNTRIQKWTHTCAALPHLFDTPLVEVIHLGLIIYRRINTKIMGNRNVKTSCKNKLHTALKFNLFKLFTSSMISIRSWCLLDTKTKKSYISLMSRQCLLTSKPCFSDGTHTSLLAAQSAWLAAENTALEVGDPGPGPAPDVRKRVTSLAPPAVGLDMVLLALREERQKKGGQ